MHVSTIFIFAFDSQTVINEAQNWSILLDHLPPSLLKQKYYNQPCPKRKISFFAKRSIDINLKMDARFIDRGFIGSYKPKITDAIPLDT